MLTDKWPKERMEEAVEDDLSGWRYKSAKIDDGTETEVTFRPTIKL